MTGLCSASHGIWHLTITSGSVSRIGVGFLQVSMSVLNLSWLTLYFMICFFARNTAAYYLKIGPKKGRRVRKIAVPTASVPEFELGDTAMNIQQRE